MGRRRPAAYLGYPAHAVCFHLPRSFQVVRTYCGHGLGELFHCAPNIPHYAGNKAVGVMKVWKREGEGGLMINVGSSPSIPPLSHTHFCPPLHYSPPPHAGGSRVHC